MKKRILCTLLALLLLSAAALSGCGVTMNEGSDSVIVDKKNDRTYNHAPVAYKPVEMGKSYGKLKVGAAMELELFEIKGMSPDEWLSTEDGDVLYAEGTTLPTLADMKPVAVLTATEDEKLHILRRISDETLVASLCDAVMSGTCAGTAAASPSYATILLFESKTVPELYYRVTYVEYAAPLTADGEEIGRFFLYDAFDGLFVPVDGSLHAALDLTD